MVKYNADKLLDLEGDFGPYWSEMLFDSSMANMLASLPSTGTQSETSWTIPGGVDIAVEALCSRHASHLLFLCSRKHPVGVRWSTPAAPTASLVN